MDVHDLLRHAAAHVPAEVTGGDGVTVGDALVFLDAGEWGTALGLLEDLGDAHPHPAGCWELLAAAGIETGQSKQGSARPPVSRHNDDAGDRPR